MTNGRNTTVLSVRLPDEVVARLRSLARLRRQTISELLKPVLGNYALTERIPEGLYRRQRAVSTNPGLNPFSDTKPTLIGGIEAPPDLSKHPDYWKDSDVRPKEKYPGTARNALCPCGSGKKYKRCCGVS